jgi:SPP1 family predicted phage head-tail adaptor
MRQATPIYLITEEYEQNEIGVMVPTQTKTKVFARITSVTGQEWFEGGRNGLNPQFRAEVYPFEYQGEEILEKDGVMYSIYRTFQSSEKTLELYCEKRKGVE